MGRRSRRKCPQASEHSVVDEGGVWVSWLLISPWAVYPVCLASLQSLSPYLKYFTFLLIGELLRKCSGGMHLCGRLREPIDTPRGRGGHALPGSFIPVVMPRAHEAVLTASAGCSHASFPSWSRRRLCSAWVHSRSCLVEVDNSLRAELPPWAVLGAEEGSHRAVPRGLRSLDPVLRKDAKFTLKS